jgi:putative two-component system response regulator
MMEDSRPLSSQKPVVLAVDDTADNLSLLVALLKDRYSVRVANSGEKALRAVRAGRLPDVILLDIMMPGVSGYEVCAQFKSDPELRHIPIIFLTALSSVEDEEKGLALGAADYITKPISPPILMARVKTQLENKAAADFLRDQASFLKAEVERQTREVQALQDVTVMAMASLAETRDSDTGNHILRTQHYVKRLAEQLGTHPRFGHFLSPENIALLFKTAPLHDIGKVGIPDRILLKPGRFTPEEFEVMKTHTTLGRDAIDRAQKALAVPLPFFEIAREIAYSHQEKWDGSGYPEGLSGDRIPISARLMAVADVYDALISRRVYKEPMPHEKAVAIIREGAGSHFDPDIVEAFLSLQDEFLAIARTYADSDADLEGKRKYHAQVFDA